MSYYYLISSLPAIIFGEKQYYSSEEFMKRCCTWIGKSDIILVMERIHEQKVLELAPEAKNKLFLLKEFAKIKDNSLNIADPIGRAPEFYAENLRIIKEAVERVSKLI